MVSSRLGRSGSSRKVALSEGSGLKTAKRVEVAEITVFRPLAILTR
jgi:hypothetical protein